MDDRLGRFVSHMRSAGIGPFVTFRSYNFAGRQIVWLARHQRKGLDRVARALENMPVPPWQTQSYNWAMGGIFALGSALFVLGGLLSLLPTRLHISVDLINFIFFLGSIPFTVAAYLQHFQAANAGKFTIDPAEQRPLSRISLIGWRPRNAGWWSTLTQFLGTIAFNVNTYDGMLAPSAWLAQDVAIWLPDMLGSALFLISAYLAFLETSHSFWHWAPRDLSWQIVFINLVGCVAFMLAAFLAYVPRGPEPGWIPWNGNLQLLIGAACFLVAALLSMKEAKAAA